MQARGLQRHHQAIRPEAMQHPRDVDAALVDAYLARRALDYLVGFTLSPVLWRKLPGARSAGRVQSVALRLICDRELEIEAFRAQEYWTHRWRPSPPRRVANFQASLTAIDGKKLGKLASRRRGLGPRHRTGAEGPALQGRQPREQAGQAPPLPALPHLDAAAGSLAQARLLVVAHHADRPAPL